MAKTNKMRVFFFLTDTAYSFWQFIGSFAFAEQRIICHLPKISAPSIGAPLELVLLSANRIKLDTYYPSSTSLAKPSKVQTALRSSRTSETKDLQRTNDCESHRGLGKDASGAMHGHKHGIHPSQQWVCLLLRCTEVNSTFIIIDQCNYSIHNFKIYSTYF